MRSARPTATMLLAAAASAVAGLVHAAAAGSHAELGTLSTLFGIAAVAQLGWAALASLRSGPFVIATGVAIQAGALGTWLAARTVGISSVEGLNGPQTIGIQDGVAVALEAVALLAVLVTWIDLRTLRIPDAIVPVLAGVMLLAAVPAMTTAHDHGSHANDSEVAASGDGAHDDGHGHGDSTPAESADDEADGDLVYPASFVSWLDTAETPEQRAAAEQLLIETTKAMEAFPNVEAVANAGFVSIGDGSTGWEHYVHPGRIQDPRILDPDDIESIVMKVNPDGTREVASAMYLLPFGTTMADAPDIAGDLTPWHDHQNLCWDGAQVVGTTDATGSCPRGTFRPTQPMIHVWVTEHECGPFAGIEGSHGDGCAHGDHGGDADDEAAADGHPDHDH